MKKLQNCKACGKEIAKGKKVVCPECGKVNKVAIYKRPWFIVLAIIVVLGVIGASSGGSSDAASSGNGSSSDNTGTSVNAGDSNVQAVEEVVEPVEVTVNDMVDVLKANALKAEKTFKGQYIAVTGVVGNIDSSGDYFCVDIIPQSEYDFEMYNVQCFIEDEHLDKVMEFEAGQEVTVVGTVKSVGEVLGYTLDVDYIK